MLPTPLTKDAWVRFRIRDIRHPTLHDVLAVLHKDEAVVGQVVDCSITEVGTAPFAAVRMNGYPQAVIVPLDCLEQLDARLPDVAAPVAEVVAHSRHSRGWGHPPAGTTRH